MGFIRKHCKSTLNICNVFTLGMVDMGCEGGNSNQEEYAKKGHGS